MKRIITLCAILFGGVDALVGAQVQTGSILVKTTDPQGAVLAGVAITISSPVLVSGSMTGATNEGGVHRFPSLASGTYSVKVELPGFQTVVRENVTVLVGQTTSLDVETLADAGRIYAFQESDRPCQRGYVAELPDQLGWTRDRHGKLGSAEPV